LSRPKAARFLVRFVFLGATAGALAGYAASSVVPSRALPSQRASGSGAQVQDPQVSNSAAKADRLPSAVEAALTRASEASYALASADPTAGLDRILDSASGAARALPYAEPAQAPEAAASLATPLPPPKPKLLPAPPAQPSGLLDDRQIAGMKDRLRLTEEQAQYWPAVEAALRDVVRTQLHDGHLTRVRGGKMNIDVNSPQVQRLIWAAMPLLMRLREDQKHEVRKLARIIGLDTVASQI
jgi:hypothetical protein